MNRRQKEVQQAYLDGEKEIIRRLEQAYRQAAEDCGAKIAELNSRMDMQNLQSVIYQKQYQQVLKKQLYSILDMLRDNEFDSVAEYLTQCYENGFIGTLYDIQGQGVPLIFPIDQAQAAKAVQADVKLSEGMYARLGEDTDSLKKSVRAELSRGIANGSSWLEAASQIAGGMNSPFRKAMNNAARIARTEGHRIQNQAQLDALDGAKARGADVVKQWDATLDSRTRPEHAKADGQTRGMDEDFDVWGEKLKAPGVGGSARNVINCRCCMLQRARWALDVEGTKYLGRTEGMTDAQLEPIAGKLGIPVGELRKYSGQIIPVKAKDYGDFRRQYEKIWNYKPVERIDIAGDFDILKNVTASNGLQVKQASKHMLERAEGRGIPADGIIDALKNPLSIGEAKIDSQGRKSQRFIGTEATVNVNPDSGVITTIWKTGSRTKKKLEGK